MTYSILSDIFKVTLEFMNFFALRMRCLLCIFLLVWSVAGGPVDQMATPETRDLYKNMMAMARNSSRVMFGHHEDTWYGAEGGHKPYITANITHDGVQAYIFSTQQVSSDYPDELSDTKRVTGQYPAVSGFDFAQFDNDHMTVLTYLAKRAYARGQVVTLSQHLNNPVTGGPPWVANDTSKDLLHPVRRILPGGDHEQTFRTNLDKIADWALAFKDSRGHPIPFVYRPFHELNGDWFWWGLGNPKTQNSPEELRSLLRYTVSYLKDQREVHNILYCMSPDKFATQADYLNVYPGNEYIDIMGTDYYYNNASYPSVSDLQRTLHDLVDMAEARDKIPALTETGLFDNGIDHTHNFWNSHVLDIMKHDAKAARVAYMLAWLNQCFPDAAADAQCDLWIPYRGHPAESDFRNNFYNDPMTYFANDIKNMMYQKNKQ